MQSEDTEIDSIGNATWRVAGSGPNSSPRSPPSGVALHLQWALPLGSVRIALISHWLVPIPRGCCSLPRRCRIGNPYSWLWVATPKDTRHALPLCRSAALPFDLPQFPWEGQQSAAQLSRQVSPQLIQRARSIKAIQLRYMNICWYICR